MQLITLHNSNRKAIAASKHYHFNSGMRRFHAGQLPI
jgi:hypothetical protein